MVMLTTAWSSRSEMGDRFVTIWAGAADADPSGEGAAALAALLAQVSVAAVAFVDGDLPAGPGGREITVGSSCWCRRRNAVFRHAVLQYNWRPTGV